MSDAEATVLLISLSLYIIYDEVLSLDCLIKTQFKSKERYIYNHHIHSKVQDRLKLQQK